MDDRDDTGPDLRSEARARLSAALRDNLRRRKAQTLGRRKGEADAGGDDAAPGGKTVDE